jgi:hypothetical protein
MLFEQIGTHLPYLALEFLAIEECPRSIFQTRISGRSGIGAGLFIVARLRRPRGPGGDASRDIWRRRPRCLAPQRHRSLVAIAIFKLLLPGCTPLYQEVVTNGKIILNEFAK